MNDKCETVIRDTRALLFLSSTSMIIAELVSRTSYPYEYIDKIFKDWLMHRPMLSERREFLTVFLGKALDVVAENNYGQTFEQLCGSDYLQQVKLLAGEL